VNKVFIFCALFFASQWSFSQTPALVKQMTFHDKNNLKLKEVFYTTDSTGAVFQGPYVSYHINGSINSRGAFEQNNTVGIWEFFYENGNLKMRGALREGSNIGPWEYFFENGGKNMEGTIENGLREGEWKFYYENEALRIRGNFVKGKRQGLWRFYYEDGKLKGEITYDRDRGQFRELFHSGKLKAEGPRVETRNEGHWIYYYESGEVLSEGDYLEGKKVGLWKNYYQNGKLASEGYYHNDEPEGQWIYYREDGSVQSKGGFIVGTKDGQWDLYYPDGSLQGACLYKMGSGEYREYYKSGKLKLKGFVQQGQNEGPWEYYFENGSLSGECVFTKGVGTYSGYYPEGTLQTRGTLENNIKVGSWELFDKQGKLKGYFKPFYDEPTLKSDFDRLSKPKRDYGVAEYKYKQTQNRFFKSGINEYHGLILGGNPLMPLIGRFPIALEYYQQERLGYEFEMEALRDPFFKRVVDIPVNDPFYRGVGLSVRQKFYNPVNSIGMWYFGHELRFATFSHYTNLINPFEPDQRLTISAAEKTITYSLLLGYRLMDNTKGDGVALDAFAGVGLGYRNFANNESFPEEFRSVPQNSVPVVFRFGLNLGYSFRMGRRGR
jgi:uncharacterized protein